MFDNIKIDTMAGSEQGSTYFMIAKNKGFKLGIRLFVAPFKKDDSIWISLCFRIRAVMDDINVSPEMATESFGVFGFRETKGMHSSAVGVLPIIAMPCSPSEFYTVFNSYNGSMEELLVKQIKETVSKAGGTMLIEDAVLVETFKNHTADLIPEIKVVQNMTPTFLFGNALKGME